MSYIITVWKLHFAHVRNLANWIKWRLCMRFQCFAPKKISKCNIYSGRQHSCRFKPPEEVWWSSGFMHVAWVRRLLGGGGISFSVFQQIQPSMHLFTCLLSGTFEGTYISLYFEQLALSITVLISKVLVLINVAIMFIDFFSLFVPRYCFKFEVKWVFFGTCTCTKWP